MVCYRSVIKLFLISITTELIPILVACYMKVIMMLIMEMGRIRRGRGRGGEGKKEEEGA